jgi:hypothetical protein
VHPHVQSAYGSTVATYGRGNPLSQVQIDCGACTGFWRLNTVQQIGSVSADLVVKSQSILLLCPRESGAAIGERVDVAEQLLYLLGRVRHLAFPRVAHAGYDADGDHVAQDDTHIISSARVKPRCCPRVLERQKCFTNRPGRPIFDVRIFPPSRMGTAQYPVQHKTMLRHQL